MNKNVLILSGSPRKGGNSDLLCDQFLRGARDAGHRAEKIRLADMTIHYCTGCGSCVAKPGKCVQLDDMSVIQAKMIAADVIVMATPVYFYTMNGQMKTLIDRTCPVYTLLQNKELYFIVAAADTNEEMLERTAEGFRGFASCLSGAQEKGVIYATGVWNKGDIIDMPVMKAAYESGKAV